MLLLVRATVYTLQLRLLDTVQLCLLDAALLCLLDTALLCAVPGATAPMPTDLHPSAVASSHRILPSSCSVQQTPLHCLALGHAADAPSTLEFIAIASVQAKFPGWMQA